AGFFERVGEGVVSDVVQQGGEPDVRRGSGVGPGAAFFQLRERAAGQVIGTEAVLEARVRGAGIDEEGVTELADIPQPLDGGGIDDGQGIAVEADVVPERVADDLEAAHWGGGGPASRTAACTRASNCRKFCRNRPASLPAMAS